MRYNYLFLCLLFLVSWGCSSQETAGCQAILNYAENQLPHWGILKNSDGFIYVDLDDGYIHKLTPFIQQQGFEEPPYFGSPDLVGAHISVVYPDELTKYGIKEISELGEKIHFSLTGCNVVHPPNWEEIEEVYFIAVDAPELDEIRQKYGLPKRRYEFHITIGVKPKLAKSA